MNRNEPAHDTSADFAQGVGETQRRLANDLKSDYDYVICGAGEHQARC